MSEARNFFPVSHIGAGVQGLGPTSTVSSGHQQGAELEEEQVEIVPALI